MRRASELTLTVVSLLAFDDKRIRKLNPDTIDKIPNKGESWPNRGPFTLLCFTSK